MRRQCFPKRHRKPGRLADHRYLADRFWLPRLYHVGFYTDFLFRLAPLNLENVGADATYSGEDFTVEPPKFGVSGGINFYF